MRIIRTLPQVLRRILRPTLLPPLRLLPSLLRLLLKKARSVRSSRLVDSPDGLDRRPQMAYLLSCLTRVGKRYRCRWPSSSSKSLEQSSVQFEQRASLLTQLTNLRASSRSKCFTAARSAMTSRLLVSQPRRIWIWAATAGPDLAVLEPVFTAPLERRSSLAV